MEYIYVFRQEFMIQINRNDFIIYYIQLLFQQFQTSYWRV